MQRHFREYQHDPGSEVEPSLVQQTELMDLRDVYWGGGQAVHLVLIVLGVWLTLWDWNVCDLVSGSFTLPRSLFVSLCQTVKRLVGRFSVQIAEIQPKIIGGIGSPLSLIVFCLFEFLIAFASEPLTLLMLCFPSAFTRDGCIYVHMRLEL